MHVTSIPAIPFNFKQLKVIGKRPLKYTAFPGSFSTPGPYFAYCLF